MIGKRIDEINIDDIQQLIEDKVLEGKNIEYKQQLPSNKDSDKIRFLATISSFANCVGGDIIYGIKESEGKPIAADGIITEDIDKDKLRLEQIIRNGIEPSIPNLLLHTISIENGNFILVVRIQQSWNSPHRVTFNDHAKFYGRNSAGKYPLDVNELKTAFILSDNTKRQIVNFKTDRIFKINDNISPVSLKDGGKLILHMIPFSSFSRNDNFSINLIQKHQTKLCPIGANGFNPRINVDGFLTYHNLHSGQCESYAQVFRNGIIETAFTIEDHNSELIILSTWIEKECIKTVNNFIAFYKEIQILPPVYLFVTFIGIKKYKFAVSNYLRQQQTAIDRDLLQLPEEVIDSFGSDASILMRPIFDMIWNAWGFERCFNYDTSGEWKER